MKKLTIYKRIIFSFFAFIPIYFFPALVVAATDVSDKVEVQTTRLSYDRRALTSYLDAMLLNISSDALLAPVKIVIENISDPTVSVANADGLIDAVKPYFEYPGLSPGESSLYKRWTFDNPLRKRFSYTFYVIDGTPATVTITGKAIAGLPVVGTINIRDSSTPPNTSYSSISADGSYQLLIDETWQSPFLMYADGWVSNTHVRLLSTFELNEDQWAITVNTTPATTAIVESAIGGTAAEIDPLTVEIPPFDIIAMIQAKVEETLAELFDVTGIPENFNLFLDEIGEVGSPTDQLFELVDFSTGDAGNIVIADVTNPDLSVVIDPDNDAPEMDQDLLDSVEGNNAALSQIRTILSGYFDLFQDQRPDRDTLESELRPNLAAGFLNSGYRIDDLISLLADNDESGPVNERFIGCSIYRTMTTQYYGDDPVEEVPDSYPEGQWVLVTSEINGHMLTWISSFVKQGDDTWKWYGNRRPIRRSTQGRPEARQFIFPADAVIYHSGLRFWHNDVGNIALDMGITNLAIFNPAFAPETIDGTPTNCIRMERRQNGLDARFSLTNVLTFWRDDDLYQIGVGRGLDITSLASQETKEFLVIGLDEADTPVSTWLYTIAQLPSLVDELAASPDHYFADVEQTSISFEPYDPVDPDNPDAFPGNDGLFSWVFPDNTELFPSHSHLGWNDDNWYWNEIAIDNPAWYSAGDFWAWTSDTYQPGPLADIVRDAQFSVVMRNANNVHYRTSRRYNPWANSLISFEEEELVFNVSHQYQAENLSDRITAFTRITGLAVNRLETDVVVEDGAIFDTSDNAIDVIAETSIRLAYHPDEYYVKDVGTGYVELVVRLSLYGDGTLSALGYIWTANQDWSTDQYVDSYSELFVGDFPVGSPALLFETPYSIAVEFDEADNKLIIELDGQSSAFDLSPYPEFDPQTFKYAEIRTRVKNLAQEGDAGEITVHYDNVMVNGALYDDFADGFSINKWYVSAYE